MNIIYRPARDQDLPECVKLFEESVADLRIRHNMPSRPPQPTERLMAFYRHVIRTGIFHVAEVEGRIGALACANLREHTWFLSGFWARPGLQRQHIGMPLVRGVWEAGREAGMTIFFVWASKELTAMAAYMKLGMLPGSQLMAFEGTPRLSDEAATGYSVQDLDRSLANQLDRVTLGYQRDIDHDYLASVGSRGRQVSRDGRAIGYYYVDGSTIGPAAWQDTRDAEALLSLACREAAAAGTSITLEIPGMNHTALRFALNSGLLLTNFSHLLMSETFGRLENYVPSGPAVF